MQKELSLLPQEDFEFEKEIVFSYDQPNQQNEYDDDTKPPTCSLTITTTFIGSF